MEATRQVSLPSVMKWYVSPHQVSCRVPFFQAWAHTMAVENGARQESVEVDRGTEAAPAPTACGENIVAPFVGSRVCRQQPVEVL